MSQERKPTEAGRPAGRIQRRVRFHWKRAVVVVVSVAACVGGGFLLYVFQQDRQKRSIIATAEALEREGKVVEALRHLYRFEVQSKDKEVVRHLARLVELPAVAREVTQDEVVRLNERLLTLDPKGKDVRLCRRRIAKAHLVHTEYLRRLPEERVRAIGFEMAAQLDRAVLAKRILQDLEREEANDPVIETKVLLGWALELDVPESVRDKSRLAEAEKKFQEALALDPTHAEAAARLAQLYFHRLDEKGKAVEVLERAIQARPGDVKLLLARSEVLRDLGRAEEARLDLKQAQTRVPPDDPELNAMVAIESIKDDLRRQETESARASFDALAKAQPGDPRLPVLELMLSMAEGRPDESISLLRDEVLTSGGTDKEAILNLINHYHQFGRITEARPLLKRLVSLVDQPEKDTVLEFLQAEQFALAGRPLEAIDRLERLKQTGFGTRIERERPFHARLYLDLARSYLALGDGKRAEEAFRQGLNVEPRSAALRQAFVDALARSQPAAAMTVLQEGLDLAPNDLPMKLIMVGQLVQRQGALPPEKRDWVEVDRRLAELAAAEPRNFDVARIRVRRHVLAGELERALAELDDLCRRSPKDLENWRLRAEVLVQLGKVPQALEVLNEAAGPQAVGDKADLRLAQARVLSRLNRGREARELVVRDLDRLSANEQALAWRGLAELLVERGDLAEARDAIDRWAKADPQDMKPLLMGLQLALNADDGAHADRLVEALGNLLGKLSPTYRLAKASALIGLTERSVATMKLLEANQPLDRRLGLAQEEIRNALSRAPRMADALILDAEVKRRLLELDRKLGRASRLDDQAVIDAYLKAHESGSLTAFPKLIDQYAARRQFDQIDKLPATSWVYDRDRLAAEVCVRRSEKDAASRFIDRAVQSTGSTPEALAWKARLLGLMGQGELAESELLRLIEQQPNELGHWLALVRLRVARGRAGEVDAIIERAKAKVTGLAPELVDGSCRQAAGDLVRADAAFQQALKAHPDDDVTALHVASYFQDTGRLSLAEGPLRAVLKRHPSERRASRSLAVLLAARSQTIEDWRTAWEVLGAEPDASADPDDLLQDRFARAVLLARCPETPRREEGARSLEGLLADLPPNATLGLAIRGELIQALLRDQEFDRATKVARDLATRSPSPMALMLLVEGLLGLGLRDEAKTQLDRLAELSPGDPREAMLRVKLLWDPAKPEASAPALEAAYMERLAKDPKYADVLGRMVLGTLDQARAADTIAARVAAKLAEKDPGISWMLARLLARQDRTREVLELCQTAALKGSAVDRIEACRLVVGQSSRTTDPELRKLAESIITASVKADPNNLDLRICQAMLHHVQGRYAEELAIYQDLVKQEIDSPVVLNNLAWALCEFSQKYDDAIKYADAAIDRYGDNPGLLDTRGVIQTRRKRADEAIKDLKRAVDTQPSPTRRFHLARAYALAGNADEARRHRDQALKDGLKKTDLEPNERADFEALSKL